MIGFLYLLEYFDGFFVCRLDLDFDFLLDLHLRPHLLWTAITVGIISVGIQVNMSVVLNNMMRLFLLFRTLDGAPSFLCELDCSSCFLKPTFNQACFLCKCVIKLIFFEVVGPWRVERVLQQIFKHG